MYAFTTYNISIDWGVNTEYKQFVINRLRNLQNKVGSNKVFQKILKNIDIHYFK